MLSRFRFSGNIIRYSESNVQLELCFKFRVEIVFKILSGSIGVKWYATDSS